MSLLCPACREPLEPGSWRCPNGHRCDERGGVLALLDAARAQQLGAFTERLSAIRAGEGKHLTDIAAYEQLPYSQRGAADAAWRAEWRMREYDLDSVLGHMPGRPCRVLDVGAWNGWLCHQLAKRGHDVTGVDYFVDEFDGLGARLHYSTRWRAIRMDLIDLSVLGDRFDLVVLNRCLQFFPDPVAYVAHARQRLAPGGVLVATGLQLFRDAAAKASQVHRIRQAFRERQGFELYLRPSKGYLDFTDRRALRAAGMRLVPYRQLWLANLKSALRPTLPRHEYGLCEAAR